VSVHTEHAVRYLTRIYNLLPLLVATSELAGRLPSPTVLPFRAWSYVEAEVSAPAADWSTLEACVLTSCIDVNGRWPLGHLPMT